MLDYPLIELRQPSGKAEKKKYEFHEGTLLEIWNFNQESTIPNLCVEE